MVNEFVEHENGSKLTMKAIILAIAPRALKAVPEDCRESLMQDASYIY